MLSFDKAGASGPAQPSALSAPYATPGRYNGVSADARQETGPALSQDADWDVSIDRSREEEVRLLADRLGAGADRIRQDLGVWFGELLKDVDGGDSDVLEALLDLSSSAGGILLLKKLKDRTDAGAAARKAKADPPMTRDRLRSLQSSPAYLDKTHPDHERTDRAVRGGYRALFPA